MNLRVAPGAAEKLAQLKAGALFVKEETKKIASALDLVKSKQSEIDFIVWIAPAAFWARKTYLENIRKKAGCFRNKICSYSVESISISDNKYLQLYNLIDKYRTFCVIDDSITIKNTEAGRTKRLLAVRHKFKYRLILSSLPLAQGLIDLYSQLEFLDSKILRMNESQFSNMFLPFYEDCHKTWRRWSRPEDEKLLVQMMRPYVLTCDMAQNRHLKYIDNDFELTDVERRSYKYEKDFFLKNRTQVAFMEVVQSFQRMYTLSYNKIQALLILLKNIAERKEKVIIYIRFLDEIIFFKESGFLNGFDFVECTGKSNKRQAVSAFTSGTDIMFCTYGVNQQDLDLSLCRNIIFFSQTFDYKSKAQVLGSFSGGKFKQDINIYNFWVRTGLEMIIRDNLTRKANVLSHVCRIISQKEINRL